MSESIINICISMNNLEFFIERRSSCVLEIMIRILGCRKLEDKSYDISSDSERFDVQVFRLNVIEVKYYLEFSEMQVLIDVEGDFSRRFS